MPKTRKEKEQIVAKLTDNLKTAKGIVLTKYQGLKVAEAEELKEKLAAQKGYFQVVKNNLLKLALKNAKIGGLQVDELSGPIAIAYSAEDEVLPAKSLWEFSKTHSVIDVISGLAEGKVLDKETVLMLAKLPDHNTLLAQTIATIQAPLSGLVNVLVGSLRGLLNVLNALKEQKP